MHRIKGSSNYLKSQVRGNLAKATISATIFAALLAFVSFRVLSNLQLDLIDEIGLIVSIAPLFAFYFYLRKYHIYSGGWQGEKQVTKLLSAKLSDEYYLIDHLNLRDSGGDIDHIILGPNGIFVLETKNWSGIASCIGDEWQRVGKRGFNGSPSRQVKRNTERIIRVLNSNSALHAIAIESIVVFTNRHIILNVKHPTATLLKLPQLPNHIMHHPSNRRYSSQELEAIASELVSHKQ